MRRAELITNLFFGLGLPLLALLIGLVCCFLLSFLTAAPDHYISITFLFWAVGFLMFLKAKLSAITRGRLLSFGPKPLSRSNRIFYVLGCIFMGIGLLLSLALMAFSHATA